MTDFDKLEELFWEEYKKEDWLKNSGFHEICNYIFQFNEFDGKGLEQFVKKVEERVCKSVEEKIWKYSFIIQLKQDVDKLCEFIDYIYTEPELTWENLYFLQGQLVHLIFMNNSLNSVESKVGIWKILERCYQLCKCESELDCVKIPTSQKNKQLVIVLSEQFLTAEHGPTKTALDRCAKLMDMGKQVLLINTAELTSKIGDISFFRKCYGNYNEKLSDKQSIQWKGKEIPYIQCEKNMPSIDTIKGILEVIKEYEPGACILVGGNSLLAGFVNELVPVLTIGTTQSGIKTSLTRFQTVEDKYYERAFEEVKRLGKENDYLIKGRFTFSLKEQRCHNDKISCGFYEDDFVVSMVGLRLDEEISDDLLQMLNSINSVKPLFIVIIGQFNDDEAFYQKYPNLKNYIVNLGMCSDVLSILEACDLYINPIRKGGATSAVEALYKGVPVITTNYGDVAGTVGEDFICNDLDEMKSLIEKYRTDKEFYEMQSRRAKEQAAICMDTDTEFEKIMNEYYNRMD